MTAKADDGTEPRFRGQQKAPTDDDDLDQQPETSDSQSRLISTSLKLGYRHWMLAFLVVVVICSISSQLDWSMPEPLPANQKRVFSEIRARAFLNQLVDLGPKPSGSSPLEKDAKDLLLREIADIETDVKNTDVHRLETDIQRPSGCYHLDFLNDFTLCYRQVLNVVVRLGPKKPSDHSLLLSCHFDTVPDSPGATDDGISCAIMVEIMRILANQKDPLPRDVVFLFNGAEENFLQAAHGFITSHPWRHTIRAFINLEGAGAGGRELLFQAGPGNGWLAKAYMESAPYPHCSVLAQEVFQTGFVPSDTDYRIYRDYGKIPGLDIAYARNGYVYHTEFDQTRFITPGAIQRAGENVLETVRTLISSPYLEHPADYHEGAWVYFDVAGLFNLFYPMSWSTWLNYGIILFVVFKIASSLKSHTLDKNGRDFAYSQLEFFMGLAVHSAACLCIMASVLAMSQVLTFLGLTMVWHARPYMVVYVYIVPGVVAGLSIHTLVAKYWFKKRPARVVELCFYDSMLAIYSLILFLFTAKGLASSFMVAIHVIFPATRFLIRKGLQKVIKNELVCFVASHLLAVAPVCFVGGYALVVCMELLIPIMARSGQSVNPEIFISILSSLGALSGVLYMSSWIYVSRKIGYLLSSCMWVLGLLLVLMMVTNFGVPYTFDEDAPRLRRVYMQHVSRKLVNRQGQEMEETGIWVTSMDFLGGEDLPEQGFIQGSVQLSCANATSVYCDLPYYVPVVALLKPEKARWLPVPHHPSFDKNLTIQLVSKTVDENNVHNLTFIADGPDHMSMIATPEPGWALTQSSFTPGYLSPGIETYFVFMAYANDAGPWHFWMTFTPVDVHASPELVTNIGLSGHFIHGKSQKSPSLRQFEDIVRQRRKQIHLAVGWWRWAMTVSSWSSRYISQYF